MNIKEESLDLHKAKKGKIEINSKIEIKSIKDLSLVYTPGVAAVSSAIFQDKKRVYDYTMKSNSVAIITDGSAVLGLGNIGPEAALPVMEGKALLFKEFADIDAFPICLNTQDTEEIINITKNIAPVFGGINLEDISAPRCFEIEERLIKELDIPVMHDDQHGTAVVILAALLNAAKVVGKNIENMKIVINGAGAAGLSVSKLLKCMGYDKNICIPVKNIIVCDSKGIINKERKDLNRYKEEIARNTNSDNISGTLENAIKDADAFIGVSKGGLLKKEMIKSMSDKPIVFAMANPVPEIMPDEAKAAGAEIIATGRSDFPNQVNNVLGFPGIFRGALDANTRITNEMKIAAAYALAGCIIPEKEKILPNTLDKRVVKCISEAVRKAAKESQ